jgi:TolA-binding protein
MPMMDMEEFYKNVDLGRDRKGAPGSGRSKRTGPMRPIAAILLPLAFPLALAACTTPPASRGGVIPPRHPLLVQAEQSLLAGDLDRALEQYRGYRSGFGGVKDAYVSDCHYWEGTIHLEKGRLAEAEESFKACLEHPARDRFLVAQCLIGLGDVDFTADRYRPAFERYRRAIDLDVPGSRVDYALYRTGLALQRLGAWREARTVLERVVREYPKSPLRARVEQNLAYRDETFHVQAGTFADAKQAKDLVVRASFFGMLAKTVTQSTEKGPRYHVWVGDYATYAAAAADARRIRALLGEAQLIP